MLNFKKNRMKKHTFCRFSILLSIILVFLLYPMSSMGAQKYISVKGEDMTIKQAIQLIEKNSEYTFFYNASDLENNTKRDYNSTGNIEKVLKDVFEGSNVSYVTKVSHPLKHQLFSFSFVCLPPYPLTVNTCLTEVMQTIHILRPIFPTLQPLQGFCSSLCRFR